MTEENNLGRYIKHQAESLQVAVKNSKTINTEDVESKSIKRPRGAGLIILGKKKLCMANI